MAIDIPNLIKENFDDKLKQATEKSIDLLRSKCLDLKIFRSEFELNINDVFREFGLEPEKSDYDKIELELNNLDCAIVERFMTFDKFIQINEGVWELPDTKEKANKLKIIVDKLKNDPNYVISLGGHGANGENDLYQVIGADGLFDTIGSMQADKTYTNEKALKAIRDEINYYLKAYESDPSDYKTVLDPEAEKILRSL